MKKPVVLAALALLSAACGSSPAEKPGFDPEWAQGVPVRTLTVTDSIGVELGDSDYVFGQVAGAMWTPDGNIAVIDMKRCAILFYTPDGEHISTLGRRGSGPGEFQIPTSMAWLGDGRLLVTDAMSRTISIFDDSLRFAGSLEGFFPTPPVAITSVDSASFVGLKPEFEQNEQGMFTGFTLARWSMDSIPATVTYFADLVPFDPGNLAASFAGNIFSFAAAPDGTVYRAPMTSEGYTIECYQPDGTLRMTIERDYQPVPKTPEEIEEERAFVQERMEASGAPAGMFTWEPEPMKSSIGGLMVDPEGDLWVRRGWTDEVVFDVFDSTGTLLYTARLDRTGDAEMWQVSCGTGGFLAFDANPESWSRVFILSLSD
ncbi:hypothetical protein GX411_05135 [Candidatus Fermentibacteria bacterium]|nr:hypothetical protein [Candidatus Fermentibacteria bacterium]